MTATMPETVTVFEAITTQTELAEALKFGNTLVKLPRHGLQILGGTLLEAGPAGLTLSRFDYETTAQTTITAVGTGRALVAANTLLDVVKDLTKGCEILLSVVDGKLAVVGDGVTYRLPLLPLEDYPSLPQRPTTHLATLTGEQFAQLRDVERAAGTDETLPVLMALAFSRSSDGHLEMAATDRYRLAVYDTGVDVDEDMTGKTLLLPSKTLSLLARQFGKAERVAIHRDGSKHGPVVTITDCASRTVTMRLVDGTFPDYRRLLPSERSITVSHVTESAALVKGVKQVSKILTFTTPIKLTVNSGTLTLAATLADTSAEKGLAGTGNGDIEVLVNPNYLLDGIAATGGADVTFRFTEATKPLLITDDERPGFTYLLMPVRPAG